MSSSDTPHEGQGDHGIRSEPFRYPERLTAPTGEPEPIRAVGLRRPGRWIAAAAIVVLVGLFVRGAAANPNYSWDVYGKYLFDRRISTGALVTVELTVSAMALGVLFGLLLAVMRLSSNAVMHAAAWVYLWVFRGTPVYVQLVFWGLFPSLYKVITVGVPFGPQLARFDIQSADPVFWFAVLGLGLNEAAYMAEIVRAGINSVDRGQTEASIALGMSWSMTMRRTVLPQAMRVIIPPTGNELIGMLKTTSLVVAIPLTAELYGRARDIYSINYRPIPLLLVAATWYLGVTSILMLGQHFLERHFSRGRSRTQAPSRIHTRTGDGCA